MLNSVIITEKELSLIVGGGVNKRADKKACEVIGTLSGMIIGGCLSALEIYICITNPIIKKVEEQILKLPADVILTPEQALEITNFKTLKYVGEHLVLAGVSYLGFPITIIFGGIIGNKVGKLIGKKLYGEE